MKALAALALVLAACSASFTGPATLDPSQCRGHLDCGGGECCIEAAFDSEDWQCGGLWPNCPAGTCCYAGTGHPGDDYASRRPFKLVKAK